VEAVSKRSPFWQDRHEHRSGDEMSREKEPGVTQSSGFPHRMLAVRLPDTRVLGRVLEQTHYAL